MAGSTPPAMSPHAPCPCPCEVALAIVRQGTRLKNLCSRYTVTKTLAGPYDLPSPRPHMALATTAAYPSLGEASARRSGVEASHRRGDPDDRGASGRRVVAPLGAG